MTIGFLRFHFFWDAIPFLSMLILEKEYRGKGIGKEFVHFWETEMKKMGYDCCMTSTLSNEDGQHFYRKLGYKDVGCLLLEEEGLEIFFLKKI
jgi:ribosomal protein S18 acetylase RimI-like enzyme